VGTARSVAATWCVRESQERSVAEGGATTTSVAREGNGAVGTARSVAATWCVEESQERSVAEGGATTPRIEDDQRQIGNYRLRDWLTIGANRRSFRSTWAPYPSTVLEGWGARNDQPRAWALGVLE
jgi:hypothetical protein